MATCFLFAQSLTDESCICLTLNQVGQVDAPLEKRSLADVRQLQEKARTIVVVPTEKCSLIHVDLPWMNERKARLAIPFALEEHLAQDVASLHFAFNRDYYQNNKYLVVVIDKHYLATLIEKLQNLNLRFNTITLDWFALEEHEAAIVGNHILVRDDFFNGALNEELIPLFLNREDRKAECIKFNDSEVTLKKKNIKAIDEVSSVWIAKKLLQAKVINLCQSEFKHDTEGTSIKRWYRACGIAGISLFICMILMNGLYLHALNRRIAIQDEKIATIYHQFFPNSPKVISPKFRITQLLKEGSVNNDLMYLWSLLNKLSRAFDHQKITIEQFQFHYPTLSLMVSCKNFSELEHFQQQLQKNNVNVVQAQAANKEKKVVATLELSLGSK